MAGRNAGKGEATGHTRGWQVPLLGTQRGGRSRGAGSGRRGAQSAHGGGYGAAPRVGLGAESHEGLKRFGGGQPPSFPWHARPQSHEIQDFLSKFLLIFHQSGFLPRIL